MKCHFSVIGFEGKRGLGGRRPVPAIACRREVALRPFHLSTLHEIKAAIAQLGLDIEGAHLRLIHIAPRNAPAGFHFLLHGHTHVPRNELVGATRVLNPGCITRPNRGAPASLAWLELKQGEPPIWSLITL